MDILIDTHIAIWMFDDSPYLSNEARKRLLDDANQIFVSDVSTWEVAVKHVARPEKVPYGAKRFVDLCNTSHFASLPMTLDAVLAYEELDVSKAAATHKDPFDRMLIAQSKAANMLFLTHDEKLALYGEPLVLVV